MTAYLKKELEPEFSRLPSKDKSVVGQFLLCLIGKSKSKISAMSLYFKRTAFSTMIRLYHADKSFAQETIDKLTANFCEYMLETDASNDFRCTMALLKSFKCFAPSFDSLRLMHSALAKLHPENEVIEQAIDYVDDLMSKMDVDMEAKPSDPLSVFLNGHEGDLEPLRCSIIADGIFKNEHLFLSIATECLGVLLVRRLQPTSFKWFLAKLAAEFIPVDSLLMSILKTALVSSFSYLNDESLVHFYIMMWSDN